MTNTENTKVIGNEMTVNALEHLCGENYRDAVKRAMKADSTEVFIPVEPTQDMRDLLEDVNQMKMIMTSSNENEEPVYISYTDFLAGRNKDGSIHKGYVVVDVISRLVFALKDREGNDVTCSKNDILTIAFRVLSEGRVPNEKDFESINSEDIGKTFISLFDGPNDEMSGEKIQWICQRVNGFGGAHMIPGNFPTLNRGFSTGFYLICEHESKKVQLNAPSCKPFVFLG
jgi:hypothetical protein